MKTKRFRSPLKQKILLLLSAGVALSLTRSFRKQQFILKSASKKWRSINRRYLYRVLNEFRHERLINYREDSNGQISVVLSEAGRQRILSFQIETMVIAKPKSWDGRWRLVFYDIPETRKAARTALREKLKELGFREWQKSVFVFPFPCHDELDFLIEFFEVRPYVRQAEIINATNEPELKLWFGLD